MQTRSATHIEEIRRLQRVNIRNVFVQLCIFFCTACSGLQLKHVFKVILTLLLLVFTRSNVSVFEYQFIKAHKNEIRRLKQVGDIHHTLDLCIIGFTTTPWVFVSIILAKGVCMFFWYMRR
jgi:hypothetical protein